MAYLKQIKQYVLIALFLSPSLTVFGAFTLMADFEDIASGTTVANLNTLDSTMWGGTTNARNSSMIVPFLGDEANHALQVSYSGSSNRIFMKFPGGLSIEGGETGTVFFQAYFTDLSQTGISFGVGSTTAGGYDDRMQSQIQLTSDAVNIYSASNNALKVGDSNYFISGEWYSFWILLNSPTVGTYEVFFQHEDSRLLKIVTMGRTDAFNFRPFEGVDWASNDTNRFSINFTANNSAATYFDNFWIDPTGRNFTSPLIPEPSTYAFVGVVGLLVVMATRRRRWKKH